MAASSNNYVVVSSVNASNISRIIAKRWWWEFSVNVMTVAGIADRMPSDVEGAVAKRNTEMQVLRSITANLGIICPDQDLIGFLDWLGGQSKLSDLQRSTIESAARETFSEPEEVETSSDEEGEAITFAQAMGEGIKVRAAAIQKVAPLIRSKLIGAWTLAVKATCHALSNAGKSIEKTDSQIFAKFVEASEWAKVIRLLTGNPDNLFSPEDKLERIQSWAFTTAEDREDCIARFAVKGFAIPDGLVEVSAGSDTAGSKIQAWAAKLEEIRAAKKPAKRTSKKSS